MSVAVTIAHENQPSPPWIGSAGDGFDQILAREAAAEIRIPVRLMPLPWERCFLAAAVGEVDAVLSASYRLRRLPAVVYPCRDDGRPDITRCLHTDAYAIYRQRGALQRPDERVAAQRGFAVVEMLSDLGIAVDDANADAGVILADLAAGRVAAAALLTEVADRLVAGSPALRQRVVRDPLVLPAKPYYLAFAKSFHERHAALCSAFWDAIGLKRDSLAWRNRLSR